MYITTLYGGAGRCHESWAAALPRAFRVGLGGDFPFPGPHDLAMIAVFLRRLAGVSGTEGTRTTMPVWDLRENGQLSGRALGEDEAKTLSPTIGRIGKRMEKRPPIVMVIDVNSWWNILTLTSIDPAGDHLVSRALREQRATQTLYWLSRSLPIVLLASERPRILQGMVVAYEPDIPPCITAICDLIVDADQQNVYSAKASVQIEGVSVQAGMRMDRAAFFSMIGLLCEPTLTEGQVLE